MLPKRRSCPPIVQDDAQTKPLMEDQVELSDEHVE